MSSKFHGIVKRVANNFERNWGLAIVSHQLLVLQLNHMAGPQGPIGPKLLHKLCSTVNITPILSTKATIDCSHH